MQLFKKASSSANVMGRNNNNGTGNLAVTNATTTSSRISRTTPPPTPKKASSTSPSSGRPQQEGALQSAAVSAAVSAAAAAAVSAASAAAACILCKREEATKAALVATRASLRMARKSKIFDREKEESLPRFSGHEIQLGELLGRGGFSNVFEVRKFDLDDGPHDGSSRNYPHCNLHHANSSDDSNSNSNSNSSSNELMCCSKTLKECMAYHYGARKFLAKHCIREKTGDARYAVKFLRRRVMANPKKFYTGAADLAIEAKFLSSLQHPNIIKMRGICDAGTSGFATGREGGYFLILDRLYDTLEDRILEWELQEKKYRGLLRRKVFDSRGNKRKNMLATRLQVAFDIAGALVYLHGHQIIFRDLKPENVGFDVRGDVKLFDFGLAKELDPSKAYGNDTYKLSGNSGSRRYMAPEVALSKPYNLLADVYSFGTMLWEMSALQKPYADMDKATHFEAVVQNHNRPEVDDNWPFSLRLLIRRSWSQHIKDRPAMDHVYKILRTVITNLRDGDERGLEHMERRSTYVFDRQTLQHMQTTQS